jgi:hypothetical protein
MKNHFRFIAKTFCGALLTLVSGVVVGQQNSIRIKIQKNINGEQMVIDTTFNNATDADAFMQQHNTNGERNENFSFNFKSPDFNWNDKEMLEQDFEDLKQKLSEEIQSFKFRFDSNSTDGSYQFHFKMPDNESWKEIEKELEDMGSKFKNFMDFDFEIHTGTDYESNKKEIVELTPADKKKYAELMKESDEKRKQALQLLQKNDIDSEADVLIKKEKQIKTQQTQKNIVESKKEGNIHNLKVYPNPNKGLLKVSFNQAESGDVTIQILDSKGKILINEGLSNFRGFYSNTFQIKNASGIYTVMVLQDTCKLVEKVVID